MAGEDREWQESTGQGDRAKEGRAGRGQKAGQGMMLNGIVQYEEATVQGRAKTQGKRAKIYFLVSGNFEK